MLRVINASEGLYGLRHLIDGLHVHYRAPLAEIAHAGMLNQVDRKDFFAACLQAGLDDATALEAIFANYCGGVEGAGGEVALLLADFKWGDPSDERLLACMSGCLDGPHRLIAFMRDRLRWTQERLLETANRLKMEKLISSALYHRSDALLEAAAVTETDLKHGFQDKVVGAT